MSDEKRPLRTEYRASIESGLKRLESEKLSFLGSSNVISKFDPGTVEEYAQLVGEETSSQDAEFLTQECSILDEDFSSGCQSETSDEEEDFSSGCQSGTSDEEEEDIHHLLEDDFSQFSGDNICTDVQSPSSIARTLDSVMGGNTPEENRESSRLTTLNFTALRRQETDGDAYLDSCETRNIGDIAENIRHDLESVSSNEANYDAAVDLTKVTHDIRDTSNGSQTETEWKSVRDASSTDPGLNSLCDANNFEDGYPEYDATANLTDYAEGIRIQSSESSNFNQISGDLKAFLEAERRGISSEKRPLDDYLETCETQDVGNIAAQIRLELAETNEAQVNGYRNGTPKARIFRQASENPKTRQPESDAAIERLKEQGIFEPVPIIHAEVDKNLNAIHELDQVIAPSVMKTMHDVSSEFSPSEDEEEDAVRELRQAAALVRAAHQAADPPIEPKILPIKTAGNSEIENNSTIPMSAPEFSVQEAKQKALSISHEPPADTRDSIDPQTAVPQEKENEFRSQIIWYSIIFILVCGIIYMLYLTGIFASISPVLDPLDSSKDDKIEVISTNKASEDVVLEDDVTFIDPADAAAAIKEVSDITAKAMAFESWLGSRIEEQISKHPAPESRIPYLELSYEISEEKDEAIKALVSAWRSSGQPEKAMEFIKSVPVTSKNSSFVNGIRVELLKSDPRFLPPVTDLSEEICDTIDPLGGGSTLTFKLKLKGENIGAFKPYQTRKQSNYRAEIAAWRLCELLECDFSVPWNRPIRIEHAVFDKLFSRSKSKKKQQYRAELRDIIWTKSDGKTYVYGTMKDWVPDFTRFPIEYTSFWKPWLSQNQYISEYKPLEEALRPLKRNKNTQKLLPVILSQSKGLTVKALAAQVSEILVFDYLIGNWDRFSGVGSWWGVNCQYKDGRIISIDNGASFPKYSNDKVYERFMMTERFSSHFIQNLRELDKDTTFKMLFPEPSKHETESFEQFWKQRASVLSRIDKLTEKYGADKVLSL